MGAPAQLNSRGVRRPAGVADYRYGNGVLSLVVCDDPRHREQTGSGRPGAKGLLHLVAGLRANENPTVLRVRPKTSARITKFSEHEANGSEFQESEGIAVEIFPILGEAATTIEPRDRTFDDPALG